jgi:hypothetical protein
MRVKWGTMGLGVSTGISNLAANGDVEPHYDMQSIPVAFNLRYVPLSATPWYWAVDLSSGCMINRISLYDENDDISDNITASKLFFAPNLAVGRRIFDRWRVSVYAGFLMILFDNNFFYGIAPGLRLEYSFSKGRFSGI